LEDLVNRPSSLNPHTLDNIASGGIYDQLAGGFHRYATDARWLVPHFEKMLYDQALLTWTYLEAYQLTHNPRYQEVVSQTLAFVKHSMTSPEGGFELGISEQPVKDALNEARSLLLAVREQRPQPMLDDKILTAWNAMMMRAFTEAYNVFQQTEYLEQALQKIMDGAIPAGHSIAIEVLQRLAIHRNHPEWRQQARQVLMHLSPLMSRYPDAFGYVLQRVYFELDTPLEIALVGPTPEIYLPALFSRFLPNKIIAQGKQPEILAEHPLLQDKPFDPQHTVAYVCHQYTCEAPFTHPEALSEFLESYNSRSFSG